MKRSRITAEERKQLADLLGLHEQYLYQCLTGRREMSAAEAMRAEKETGGRLTRQMLCQKSFARIWPELAKGGSPCSGHHKAKA